MGQFIAVANRKGGVGKTALAVNLAAALAGHFGRRTLLVDLDKQCNATDNIKIPPELLQPFTVQDAIAPMAVDGPSVYDCVHDSGLSANLAVLRGHHNLSTALREYVQAAYDGDVANFVIAAKGALMPLAEMFDYIIFDTPPNDELLEYQVALATADHLVVPTDLDIASVKGVSQVLSGSLNDARDRYYNSTLSVAGVVLVRYDARLNAHRTIADYVRELFGEAVLTTTVPELTAVKESRLINYPIEFVKDCDEMAIRKDRQIQAKALGAASIYRNIALELLDRIEGGAPTMRIQATIADVVTPELTPGITPDGSLLQIPATAAS